MKDLVALLRIERTPTPRNNDRECGAQRCERRVLQLDHGLDSAWIGAIRFVYRRNDSQSGWTKQRVNMLISIGDMNVRAGPVGRSTQTQSPARVEYTVSYSMCECAPRVESALEGRNFPW